MLYYPFKNIQQDFGNTEEDIIQLWESFKTMYSPWHVHRSNETTTEEDDSESPDMETQAMEEDNYDEWQFLSGLQLGEPIQVDELPR